MYSHYTVLLGASPFLVTIFLSPSVTFSSESFNRSKQGKNIFLCDISHVILLYKCILNQYLIFHSDLHYCIKCTFSVKITNKRCFCISCYIFNKFPIKKAPNLQWSCSEQIFHLLVTKASKCHSYYLDSIKWFSLLIFFSWDVVMICRVFTVSFSSYTI